MEIEDRDVYQDQPTIAVLKVYSRNMDNLRKVRIFSFRSRTISMYIRYQFYKSEIDPSDMEEYGLPGIAVFMVFPNEAGYGSTGFLLL
jgi:hypothetical protein